MTEAGPVGGVDTSDMLVVHGCLRREFRLLPGLVCGVAEGDRPRAERVAEHVVWLAAILHHHHESEDRLLWPLLRERAPAALGPTVQLMETQHAGVAAVSEKVAALLAAWRETAAAGSRDTLAERLQVLHDLLVEHLDLEEREMLPLASSVLTDKEWGRLGEEGMASVPGKDRPLVLGMFMYEGDPAVIRRMLSHAPLLPRLLMPRLAPRVHRRHAQRLHGTATS